MTRAVVCPECGFERQVPSDLIPDEAAWATCPRCGFRFSLAASEEPGALPYENDTRQEAQQTSDRGESVTEGGVSSPSPSPAELTGVGALFDRSFTIFKERVGTLLLLLLLTVVLVVAPVGILMGVGFVAGLLFPAIQGPLVAAGGVTGFLVGLAAAVYGGAAFLCAVTDRDLDMRRALEKGWECYLPLSWLFVLGGFLQGGATLFFVIPGIILWVSFAFAPFIVIENRAKGFDALAMSLEYCSRHWFAIFFRLLVVWLTGIALGAIPLAGALLSLLYIPFQYVLVRELYRDVVAVRGSVAPAGGGMRVLLVIVALLGWLVVPLAILFVAGIAAVGQLLVI